MSFKGIGEAKAITIAVAMELGRRRLDEEGYVSFKDDTFKYDYQHKDHLGNIRMAFTDVNGDRAITTSEIIEEHNY